MIRFCFFCMLFFLQFFSGFTQTYWKVSNEKGEVILLTLEINTENNSFVAHSRKDALKDLAGSFTFMLAKTAGKLKYAEIIHIEGRSYSENDTTNLSGIFTYLDRSQPFEAKICKDKLEGILTDNRDRKYLLHGIQINNNKPLYDFSKLVTIAFYQTELFYYDDQLSINGEWKTFKNKLNELKANISDDYELNAAFYWCSKKLPFTPYEIRKIVKTGNAIENNRTNLPFRELNPKSIYLELSSLKSNKEQMEKLFRDILQKNCTNLILDGRGRRTIDVASAILLTNHLISKPKILGLYLTRKGVEKKVTPISSVEYEKLYKPYPTSLFSDFYLYNESGRLLKTDPSSLQYKGKIYFLTDARTSKTNEALAISLKSIMDITLVGQKSSGSPMLNERITLDKTYELNIPTAQFFSADGKIFTSAGVVPDITVVEDALQYLMNKIIL